MRLENLDEDSHEHILSILLLLKRNIEKGVSCDHFDDNLSQDLMGVLRKNGMVIIKEREDEEDECPYYYHITQPAINYIEEITKIFKQKYSNFKKTKKESKTLKN